ncbi:hypothetical protein MHYP_G00184200 [Metynnis hypsauchen]
MAYDSLAGLLFMSHVFHLGLSICASGRRFLKPACVLQWNKMLRIALDTDSLRMSRRRTAPNESGGEPRGPMEFRWRARSTREVNGAYVGRREESYRGRGRDRTAQSPENLAAVVEESKGKKKDRAAVLQMLAGSLARSL